MDRSDAESAGLFSRGSVSHLQVLREVRDHLVDAEALEYSHDGPIRRRKRGYILEGVYFTPAGSP
eukprot:1176041-Prorocentrum_minimum.AAC.2